MATTKYTYSIANDFPGGKVNTTKLDDEIRASSIITALNRIDTSGDVIDIWFKNTLSTGDKTTLDGDATGPAGGLIAAHDNSPTPIDTKDVVVKNTQLATTIWKPSQNDYTRIYLFSCDFTKKETWYSGSTKVTEAFSADSSKKNFALAYGSGNGDRIICLNQGLLTDENLVAPPSGVAGGYVPVVDIDGVGQTEREFDETTGGQYAIDYIAGILKFFTAPPSGSTVNITYYASPSGHGPQILAGPPTGKKWVIDSSEVQMSVDVNMTDSLLQNVLVDVPIFDGSGNYLFTAYNQKATTDAVYHRIGNILDYTYGSFPIVPAFGGDRGLTKDTIILRWDYLSSLELVSSLNARMKVWTKHARGFEGERATVTIYGVETDE